MIMANLRFLYFPLLAFWSYFHVTPIFRIPFLIILAFAFSIQILSREAGKLHWSKRLSVIIELVILLPCMYYGDSPIVPMFLVLIPCFLAYQYVGKYITFLCVSFFAATGIVLGISRHVGNWDSLVFPAVFLMIGFAMLIPIFDSLKRRETEFSLIDGVVRHFEGNADWQATLQALVQNVISVVGIDYGAVYLWEEKVNRVVPHALAGKIFDNLDIDPLAVASGTLEWVIKENKIYVSNDLSLDPRYVSKSDQKLRVVSMVCVPIEGGNKIRGAFVCGSTLISEKVFTETDINTVKMFARYMTLVLEQEGWNQTNVQLLQELEALHACCSAVTSSLEREEVLHLVSGFALRVLEIKDWTLFLFDPVQREFIGHHSTTAFMEEVHDLRISWGEGALSQAVIRREFVMIPDLSKNPLVTDKENRNGRFLSMLVLPLLKNEKVLGALQISDTVPRLFSEEEIRFASSLGALVSVVLSETSFDPSTFKHA